MACVARIDVAERWRVARSRTLSWPRVGTALACALVVLAFACVGMVVAERAAGPGVRTFALGTAEISATPSVHGGVDIYVPVVDWGVRSDPYRVPLRIGLEFRSLDRDAALEALRSGALGRSELELIGKDLESAVRAELRRSAVIAIGGGAAGGLVGGLVLVVLRRGRRWLLVGPALGCAAALAAIGVFALDLSRADYQRAIDEPTFYARGEELPELLAFSSELLSVSKRYTESLDQAVAGLTSLVASAGGGSGLSNSATTIVLASDLHTNTFVLPVLARYAHGQPVFLAGDFSQLGTPLEQAVVPGIASLSDTVVAVSGNHDSRSLMLSLASAGVTVLTRSGQLLPDGRTTGDPVVEIAGLRVAGYDDPGERDPPGFAGYFLPTQPEDFETEARRLVEWFEGLPERPDVVVIHQHGLAHALLDAVAAEDGPPLYILTGHDHDAHYHVEGNGVLLDGGTVGAGGAFDIGEASAGFALLHLDRDKRPLAIDLIEVEPLSGQGTVERVVPTLSEEDTAPES